MHATIEKEYKILLTEKQYKILLSLYPNAKKIIQTNTYFDTISNQFTKQKLAFRIRNINNTLIATFKYYQNNDLMEIEKTVTHDFLNDQTIQDVFQQFHITETPIENINITTVRHLIETEAAHICIDMNTFDDNSIDYELEYEVIQPHNDLDKFNEIINQISLEYKTNAPSKLARALGKK